MDECCYKNKDYNRNHSDGKCKLWDQFKRSYHVDVDEDEMEYWGSYANLFGGDDNNDENEEKPYNKKVIENNIEDNHILKQASQRIFDFNWADLKERNVEPKERWDPKYNTLEAIQPQNFKERRDGVGTFRCQRSFSN